MVTVLEGTGRFTVGGEVFLVSQGETLIMPKDIPPALSPRRSKCCESDQTSWMSDRPPAIRTRGLYRRPMRSDVLRRS